MGGQTHGKRRERGQQQGRDLGPRIGHEALAQV